MEQQRSAAASPDSIGSSDHPPSWPENHQHGGIPGAENEHSGFIKQFFPQLLDTFQVPGMPCCFLGHVQTGYEDPMDEAGSDNTSHGVGKHTKELHDGFDSIRQSHVESMLEPQGDGNSGNQTRENDLDRGDWILSVY